jgi:Fe-S-cluster-containing dehydrogenase component
MNILTTPHMDRCIGCHSCSLACARLVHGLISWQHAGIRIQSSGGLSSGFIAQHCLACVDPACASVCPSGALTPRNGGGILFRQDRCLRCGDCLEACPVGAIVQDREGHVFVCIHCGQCVSFCPHGCLELRESAEAAREERP